MISKFLCSMAIMLGIASSTTLSASQPSVTMSSFGKMADGREATLYSLVNSNGMRADISNYGAIIVRLFVPDRKGRFDDVVLGYNSIDGYLKETPYFGAVVGRYGNRIAKGQFSLDGKTYSLVTNNKPGGIPCHLHGGTTGYDKVLWQGEAQVTGGTPTLTLRYLSKDGEEGYPGNLSITVTYSLADDNSLKVSYNAVTDKATPINLTQHSYFNLKGEGEGDILGHVLTLKASRTTPVDAGLIPTGKIESVKGTPLDFTEPHSIGSRISEKNEQLAFGGGYDHNWVLDNQSGQSALAAEVFEPVSGRIMQIWTQEPGIQFYCGNFLDGSIKGKSGRAYAYRNGFCLETQHYPDSPNQANFPSTILRPGQVYQTTTVFRFSAL